MSAAIPSYRSDLSPGHDGFGQLLRAEWTKLRTVRGWVVGLLAAAVAIVLVGLVTVVGSQTCSGPDGKPCTLPVPPLGPDGEAVRDSFSFVHQSLVGDGSITVRVTSLTSPRESRVSRDHPPAGRAPSAGQSDGLQPWAKAGIMLKESTAQGSSYVAMMITGSHGVRLQFDYTHDVAGGAGAVTQSAPRWLRLTRSGDTVTGFESSDGTHWNEVGNAPASGLSATVLAGPFVTSPDYQVTTQSFGVSSTGGGPTEASATFDHVDRHGAWDGGSWRLDQIGGNADTPGPPQAAQFSESHGIFQVRGGGDIAPAVGGPEGDTVEQSLVGTFAGLIVLVVLGSMVITAEYRRGLIRTTLVASRQRGRALAAKAIVLAAVAFVTGLAGATVAFLLVGQMLRHNGRVILPVSWLTEVRVVTGTALLLAVASVLALSVGAMFRRSAGAVAAVIVVLVLPYLLSVASVLPAAPAQWLLRVTPAAGFAIQQSIPAYPQVDAAYLPVTGYFPLAPWAGLAVLCAWTALALGLATLLIRRRDV